MKTEYDTMPGRSMKKFLVRAGIFVGIVASLVIIARMITGRHQAM